MRGTAIGAYCLLDKIGEGGMGTVWLAEHTLLGRRAAIKLLHQTFSTSEAIVQRFFNEAKAVAAIADPGIVQIFDFGVHADGAPYLVMELLEGEALDARVRRVGRLSPEDAVRAVRQVAMSLAAVHAKGVIHRDLKPENLFVARDPAMPGGERVKVLDFGIAKLSRFEGKHKTRTGAVIGTPTYMSPEQCRAIGNIDHRADIYSLGAVLFCLVTGRPPFEGEGAGDVIISHVRDQPPVPSAVAPGVPMGLDSVILRCLEKEPARRYQTMDELAQALERIDVGPRERAATGAIESRRAATAAPGPAAMASAVASGAVTLPTHPITTISDAPGEVSPTRRAARRRWLGLGLAAAVGLLATIVIAAGGSGEVGTAGEPGELGGPGGFGEKAPPAGLDPAGLEPAGSAAAAAAVAPADAAPVVVPDAAAAAAPEVAGSTPVPGSAASPEPSAGQPIPESSTAPPTQKPSAVQPTPAPAPVPRPVQVQKPRDKRRDKEATTRHGADTKTNSGSAGRIDRGD